MKGKRYFVGVSLGQYNQWTSFVIIEQIEAGEEFIYHIGQAERFPLKTSYPEIAKRVKSVWDNLKEHAGFHNDRYIVMDITGVGESIVKIIEKQDLTIDSKVTITNGTIASRNEKIHKKWNVPKKDLVSALQAVFHTDRIIIAKGISDEKIIVQELQDFRIDKISLKKDPASFEESWREGDNDDYVYAVAVAIWKAEKSDNSILAVMGYDDWWNRISHY